MKEQIIHFTRHWTREIVIALIFAVIAAIIYEGYINFRENHILDNNQKATALLEVYDKNGNLLDTGSGVFINQAGALVTNYHVIKNGDMILAKLTTGAYYKLKDYIGLSEKKDIALLQFDSNNNPVIYQLGDSDDLYAGEKVLTIGSPIALENSVSEGIISNPKRTINNSDYIQFTAPISPGNSGGGLFDHNGKLVGITSASIEDTGTQNLNFAIPINLVNNALVGQEPEMTKDSPQWYYWQGFSAENKKDYDKAEEYFLKAISIDEKYVDAYLDLGLVYYEKNLFDKEVEMFKKAVELAPENSDAHYYLATAYEDVNEYNLAIEEYQKTIILKPDDKDSMYALGILYFTIGNTQKALQLIPQLMQLDPGLGRELKILSSKIKAI